MKNCLFLFAVLGFVGCSGSDKDSSEETVAKCEIKVNKTIPASGASDFYYRGVIEFQLSDPDDTAKITTDIPGATTMSDDGKILYYTPSSPLTPNTDYSVTLDYCGGSVDLAFSTSGIGEPIADPKTLEGKAFNLDLAKANIVQPAGVGSVLSSLLTTPVLVGVVTADATTVQMMGAIGLEGTTDQDFCNPSIPFPAADFKESPYFKIGPADTTLSVSGADIKIKSLEITGTFASDGSEFAGGTLAGTIDARDIATALPDLGYDAQGLCDLLAGFGATCIACSDSQPYCLDLVANSITAEGISGTLVEVADKDCPGCEDGAPVCPQ